MISFNEYPSKNETNDVAKMLRNYSILTKHVGPCNFLFRFEGINRIAKAIPEETSDLKSSLLIKQTLFIYIWIIFIFRLTLN